MRFLPVVLLCSYCLLGSANQASTEEADCDDPNVFLAADEVLQFINENKASGNQFVLYRITEANKKEEGILINIFIKFKIQESVCEVKNGLNWKLCAFKDNGADYRECSANVQVNTEIKRGGIFNHHCSDTKGEQPKLPEEQVIEPIVPAVNRPCLGCFHVIDTTSELLVPIMKSAIEKINRIGNHQFHFDLENFITAKQQVVSGWNYKLEYEIRQTNCSKSLVPKWTPEECSLDKNGQGGQCTTDVFVTPNEEIRDILLNCHSSTGFCLSCPDEVERNVPALLNLLEKFIEEYNSHSNHTKLYKVQSVETASRKLVQNEKQYKVTFTIQETNCSKSDYSVLGEECGIEPASQNLSCNANISVGNETVNVLPDYTCDTSAFQRTRIVIKGLSPLRSVMPILTRSQRRISRSSKKSNHEKKEKKDKKNKKGKKHNGKDYQSSEESAEEDRKKPQVLPRPTQQAIPQVAEIDTSVLVTTTQQVNPTDVHMAPCQVANPTRPDIPPFLDIVVLPEQVTIHEIVILDFPSVAPEQVPKCPGKLWQPFLPTVQIHTDKPFIIDGLSFDDSDLLP
ncbi:T-kininogen 2-like isoform X1 [Bufo gargarizans]|uniref:T-kininogen 2-like isoform X1 n=1 Tax=Bufo gargarizans TaxID=30331 RepID=UPI001CF4D729|nr:T-kininogen 2-like isoform X1 [Bufo gargarizans]